MDSPRIQAAAVVSSVSDTQDSMVTASIGATRAPSPTHRWWAVPLVVASFAIITGLLVVSVLPASVRATNADSVPTPYALVPASAEDVAPLISFDAVPRHPASGELMFVTIREPKISLLDSWLAKPLPEVSFLTREQRYGTQTPSQQQQANIQMMRTAQQTAEYVALHHLGYPAEIVPGEVIINQILCLKASADGQTCAEPAPADELLDPGDTLREVDGSALSTIDDLGPVLARHKVGDSVHVKFDRPGKGKQEGDVTLIASNDGTNRAIIGFQPVDTATAKLPFEVTIRTEAIGGPSAGLAFTLTLIDELTPGELTGKNRIAVTGTINADGTVGAIGGLNAKTSAVKQAGAKVFIVPSEQGHDPDNPDSIETAKKVAGNDLIIVDVKNLDEALAALAKYGGNSGSLGQPGADYKPTT